MGKAAATKQAGRSHGRRTKRSEETAAAREDSHTSPPTPVPKSPQELSPVAGEAEAEQAEVADNVSLSPEEDDQLDDVLNEMTEHLAEPEGILPPDDDWHEQRQEGVEDDAGQLADVSHPTFRNGPMLAAPHRSSWEPVGPAGTLIAHCGTRKITREELALISPPQATRTHQPIAHDRIVTALVEALSFRHISVVREEYAVSPDGGKMFGVLDLNAEWSGVRFSVGLRNSNDKSMRLGMTVGYRVTVCDNMMFKGDFTPVLFKHTRKLELLDVISVGVDRMQRSFAPLKEQIGAWRGQILSDDEARLAIYRAFLEERFPRMIMAEVHQHYFQPAHDEFRPAPASFLMQALYVWRDFASTLTKNILLRYIAREAFRFP